MWTREGQKIHWRKNIRCIADLNRECHGPCLVNFKANHHAAVDPTLQGSGSDKGPNIEQ
jgi:hypothetical protein